MLSSAVPPKHCTDAFAFCPNKCGFWNAPPAHLAVTAQLVPELCHAGVELFSVQTVPCPLPDPCVVWEVRGCHVADWDSLSTPLPTPRSHLLSVTDSQIDRQTDGRHTDRQVCRGMSGLVHTGCMSSGLIYGVRQITGIENYRRVYLKSFWDDTVKYGMETSNVFCCLV